MAGTPVNPEQQFLIKMAIDRYNQQFNTKIGYSTVEIFSIPPNANTDLGYELVTKWQLDDLRLRMYLLFGAGTILSKYTLEVDNTFSSGVLGDEVFVTLGTLDEYYKNEKVYRFGWIERNTVPEGILLVETGFPLLTESGEFILLEN